MVKWLFVKAHIVEAGIEIGSFDVIKDNELVGLNTLNKILGSNYDTCVTALCNGVLPVMYLSSFRAGNFGKLIFSGKRG